MTDDLNVKILFIDDEQDMRDIFTEIMQSQFKYSFIETSASIEDALEKFKQQHFDVLIIDMRFNSENRGWDILELGDDSHNLAANMIIFTANDDVMDCRKAFKMGAWDYIPKNMTELNPYEEIHKSIQDAVQYREKWGNSKDANWISENIDELIEKYPNRYIAVMDAEVLAEGDNEDELKQQLLDNNLPILTPLIFRVSE